MFARFFVDRPIFATVLSLVIVIVGLVALTRLPIAQYPEVAPPTIQVSAVYPGADAETVASTVATPIEQEVNGVERMLYMASRCTNDGQMFLDVTFELGTNLDTAQVLVQNRVSVAEAKLPEDVKRIGVTTKKKSPSILLCVNLVSEKKPNGSFYYDQLYLSNYASLSVKDDLARVKGVGDVTFLGPRDYSMRVWLDPQKLASLGMTAADVIKAIREQNVQVAAGRLGQPPVAAGAGVPFQLVIKTQGRLSSEQQFDNIIVKTGEKGEVVNLRDVVRKVQRDEHGKIVEKGTELGAKNYDVNSYLDGEPSVTLALFQLPGSNALTTAKEIKAKMKELKAKFPRGVGYKIVYDTTVFIDESIHEVYKTLFEAFILVFIVVLVFLQDWRATLMPMIDVPVSLIGTFAVMALLGFSLNNLTLFGLVLAIGIVVDDAIVVVENIERWMAKGLPPRGDDQGHGRNNRTGHRHHARAQFGLHSHGFSGGHHGPVLPAIRPDHRRFYDHLGDQRHDHGPGARGNADQAARTRPGKPAGGPAALGACGIDRLRCISSSGDAGSCHARRLGRRSWARKRGGRRVCQFLGARLGRPSWDLRLGQRTRLVRRSAGELRSEPVPVRLQLGL